MTYEERILRIRELSEELKTASPERIDDFAMREYTVPQAEDLYELISRRYRRGALILTTNRAPADLYPLFPNPVLAEGFLDRLLNSAYVVTMLGRSYRPRQRPGDGGKEGPPEPSRPM